MRNLDDEYAADVRTREIAVADALQAVAERIAPIGAWIQHQSARNRWGGVVDPTAPDACAWCVSGAVQREGHDRELDDYQTDAMMDYIDDAFREAKLPAVYAPGRRVVAANDHPDAAQDDIVQAIRTAAATIRVGATTTD